jgi:hypothetical protein
MFHNSHRVLLALAVALSIASCTLIVLLPAGSLIVDLVYQAF